MIRSYARLLLAVSLLLPACAQIPDKQAQQASDDRALVCNSLVYYAPPLEAAEMALAVAEYGERVCELTGMVEEMERSVCAAWKKEHKITDAECTEWITELRSPAPPGYFDGAEGSEDGAL